MPASCERSALVEAVFDGRVGPAEQASMERHLKSCAPCGALREELAAIRRELRSSSDEPTALVHQRARLALLRRAATPSASSAGSWRRRPVALVAAALVMVPVIVWAATSSLSRARSALPG